MPRPPNELWAIARVHQGQAVRSAERKWRVPGLPDQRYRSVINKGDKDAGGWNTDGGKAVTTQR